MRVYRRYPMPDFGLFPQFLAALAGGWFTVMSGLVGVLGFIAALMMAFLKKPVAFGSLLTLACIGLVVASYEVWRVEYVKNATEAYFRFRVPKIETIGDPALTVVLNVQNDTPRPLTIDKIDVARIWIADTAPFLKLSQNSLQCKTFIYINPAVEKQMRESQPEFKFQRWQVPGRPDVWFEYLHIQSVKIDDIPKSTAETIFAPGAGHILTIEVSSQAIDRTQYADVILCPAITFSTNAGTNTVLCPGTGQGKSTINGQILRQKSTDENLLFPIRAPKPEEKCKAI